MSDAPLRRPGLKAKLAHEMREYFVIFLYLALFFAVFAWHRRLILTEEMVPITDYWAPLIEAAVLAKVVLIMDLFKFGHLHEEKPLIVPTLYKTIVFGIAIAAFGVFEQTVRGLLHHQGLAGGVRALAGVGRDELISRSMVKLCALIPFFAFREVGRVLGEGKLASLFWRRSAGP